LRFSDGLAQVLTRHVLITAEPLDAKDGNVPTIITWSQGGSNVYVTGTFNNWKQKVRLNKR